jgi:hypothetical protein
MLIPYSGPPTTPSTSYQQSSIAGSPCTQIILFAPLFSLVNTRPVPLLSGSLPLFLHDIISRMGHTPLSFHYFRGATQLANPYIGALFLQSHYLMGPCCSKHLSSLLQAISSEPYSLLYFTADTLTGALFLRHLYTRHTPYIVGISASLH